MAAIEASTLKPTWATDSGALQSGEKDGLCTHTSRSGRNSIKYFRSSVPLKGGQVGCELEILGLHSLHYKVNDHITSPVLEAEGTVFQVEQNHMPDGTTNTTIYIDCLTEGGGTLETFCYDNEGNLSEGGISSLDAPYETEAKTAGHFKRSQLPQKIDMAATVDEFLCQVNAHDGVDYGQPQLLEPVPNKDASLLTFVEWFKRHPRYDETETKYSYKRYIRSSTTGNKDAASVFVYTAPLSETQYKGIDPFKQSGETYCMVSIESTMKRPNNKVYSIETVLDKEGNVIGLARGFFYAWAAVGDRNFLITYTQVPNKPGCAAITVIQEMIDNKARYQIEPTTLSEEEERHFHDYFAEHGFPAVVDYVATAQYAMSARTAEELDDPFKTE